MILIEFMVTNGYAPRAKADSALNVEHSIASRTRGIVGFLRATLSLKRLVAVFMLRRLPALFRR